jgi:hypothetical protein
MFINAAILRLFRHFRFSQRRGLTVYHCTWEHHDHSKRREAHLKTRVFSNVTHWVSKKYADGSRGSYCLELEFTATGTWSYLFLYSGQTIGCHTAIPDQYLVIFVFAIYDQPFKRRHQAPVLAVQLCISVCLTLAPTTLIMTSDFFQIFKTPHKCARRSLLIFDK